MAGGAKRGANALGHLRLQLAGLPEDPSRHRTRRRMMIPDKPRADHDTPADLQLS